MSTHTREVCDLNHPSCRTPLAFSYRCEMSHDDAPRSYKREEILGYGNGCFTGLLQRKGRKCPCRMALNPGTMCHRCALPQQGLVQSIWHLVLALIDNERHNIGCICKISLPSRLVMQPVRVKCCVLNLRSEFLTCPSLYNFGFRHEEV